MSMHATTLSFDEFSQVFVSEAHVLAPDAHWNSVSDALRRCWERTAPEDLPSWHDARDEIRALWNRQEAYAG